MKPLILWHWNRLPSLREIDNQIKSFAKRGFGAAIIVPESGFLSPAFFEALRGSCRSAYRCGISIITSDDSGFFGGHGGGEVVSVPEFRAKAMLIVPENALREGEIPILKKDGKAVVIRRAEPRDGICPADVFNPRAAAAFTDCVYRRLKRETARFMGYELKGIFSRSPLCPDFWGFPSLPYSERLSLLAREKLNIGDVSAEELFFGDGSLRKKYEALAEQLCNDTFYAHIKQWCGENGLELIRDKEVSIIKSAFPLGEINAVFADGGKLVAADGDAVSLSGTAPAFSGLRPCADGDELWTSAAMRLSELFDGRRTALKAVDADGIKMCRIDKENSSAYFFANPTGGRIETNFCFADSRPAHIFDTVGGEAYFLSSSGEIHAALEAGGSLAVLCGGYEISAEPLPPFTRSGAVLKRPKKTEKLPLVLVEAGENVLRLGEGDAHSFEAECADGELYAVVPGGKSAFLNGAALKPEGYFLDPDFTRFNITGLVRLGHNSLKCDVSGPAFITGDLWTDGEKLLAASEAALGDAAESGMPHYVGELIYESKLPGELEGRNYLRLCGSFTYARVKIGRRRERLICQPFMLPLYSADAGRTAEIIISGGLENFLGTADTGTAFGLDGAHLYTF